jgi:hypothetical protein
MLIFINNIKVQVSSDDAMQVHVSWVTIPLVVKCPNPRPITNFNIQPLYSSFGMDLKKKQVPESFFSFFFPKDQKVFLINCNLGSSLGNILYWNACIVEAECCCPCKYEIRRNGELVGVSKFLNYTGRIV